MNSSDFSGRQSAGNVLSPPISPTTPLHHKLFTLREEAYREFQAPLIPTVPPERILGIRIPILRKFARQFSKTPDARLFLAQLPHCYYDEDHLHAFLISQITDVSQVIAALDAFLPFIDNWSTCDSLRPVVFSQHRAKLLPKIREWLASAHPYTVRFGIEMLMVHFLGEEFSTVYPEWVAAIRSDEYYVRMMVAWYFATALAFHYDAILPFFLRPKLESWTHNKAIQKALESYRITPEQKDALRRLRIPRSTGITKAH